MDEENSYLCGYLKISGLTSEYPELVTFFEGEIISDKHPFLTRKWDADEEVDRKHWVRFTNIMVMIEGFGYFLYDTKHKHPQIYIKLTWFEDNDSS